MVPIHIHLEAEGSFPGYHFLAASLVLRIERMSGLATMIPRGQKATSLIEELGVKDRGWGPNRIEILNRIIHQRIYAIQETQKFETCTLIVRETGWARCGSGSEDHTSERDA